jgi:ABC-type multidrug transport system fused ATPase/permease subunit
MLVDGVDLRMLDVALWREQLGVVNQDPFLFHASIRENIAYGKPTATMEEIVAAAGAAHAEEFIAQCAEGYETIVGERGARLSGGQRQRIALARALVRQPRMLILDEATSALDSESELQIQRALDEQRGARTVLAIAHRLSTVAHADQILVLAEGKLMEQGTHHELLAREGIYARLWRLQSGQQDQQVPATLGARSA